MSAQHGKYLREDRWGFTVDIERQKKRFRSYFPKHGAPRAALNRAGIWRDKIVKQHPLKKIRTKCLSNTGYVGISETTKWEHSRPYPCFSVSWQENGKLRSKKIIYGGPRSRAKALAMAIKLRKEKTR